MFFTPILGVILYLSDVISDWLAVFVYARNGLVFWSVVTLVLILVCQVVSSVQCFLIVWEDGRLYKRLTDSRAKRILFFTAFMLNLGNPLFMIDELIDRYSDWKAGKWACPSANRRRKQRHLSSLSFIEIFTEGIGQTILQMFVLCISLGRQSLFVPQMFPKADRLGNITLAEIDDKGLVQQNLAPGLCKYWVATGPYNCWSNYYSSRVNSASDCHIFDCSGQSSLSRATIVLPLFQLATSIFNFAFVIVHRVNSQSLSLSLVSFASKIKKVLFYLIFVPFTAWTLMSSAFMAIFLGLASSAATGSVYAKSLTVLALLSLLRIIFPHRFNQKSNKLTSIGICCWKIIGPMINLCLYIGVSVYFFVTKGCDILPGHRISFFKDGRNLYYDTNPGWDVAMENFYEDKSAFPGLTLLKINKLDNLSRVDETLQMRADFDLFDRVHNWFGFVCLFDSVASIFVFGFFYYVMDPWTLKSNLVKLSEEEEEELKTMNSETKFDQKEETKNKENKFRNLAFLIRNVSRILPHIQRTEQAQ